MDLSAKINGSQNYEFYTILISDPRLSVFCMDRHTHNTCSTSLADDHTNLRSEQQI